MNFAFCLNLTAAPAQAVESYIAHSRPKRGIEQQRQFVATQLIAKAKAIRGSGERVFKRGLGKSFKNIKKLVSVGIELIVHAPIECPKAAPSDTCQESDSRVSPCPTRSARRK